MSGVPAVRIRGANDAPVRGDGDYVLYWMIANRRTRYNHALDRALDLCEDLAKPLLVLEALRCDYPHASDRHHRFLLDGMKANARDFAGHPVRYLPYVEPERGAGKGLLAALAKRAAVVVTDEWPSFFLPAMVEAAARRLRVRLETVDACGLHPLRAADRAFPTAHSFRRHLQRTLPALLGDGPRAQPFRARTLRPAPSIERAVLDRWPAAAKALLDGRADALRALPIDHDVPATGTTGGQDAGRRRLRRFLRDVLPIYAEDRNHPDAEATSGLSPYLHYGHVSTHEVFERLARQEGWSPGRLAAEGRGQREGWWGMGPSAEAFLDQVVTWREVGFNFQALRGGADDYTTLPDWAQRTLAAHRRDRRAHVLESGRLEEAATGEALWDAAQRELRDEGRIHTYLRMLWGKRVLAWTRTPEEAWDVLLRLNDRWALDGRDPNSLSGIGWCFGRYDRPWGPERPIQGVVRYLSPANTARKLRLADWLGRHGEG